MSPDVGLTFCPGSTLYPNFCIEGGGFTTISEPFITMSLVQEL